MSKEKDFFKRCFNTIAELEVKNESQAIAKEVVLSEIENLKQENKQLKEIIKENTILVKDEYGDYQECNIKPLEMKQKYEKLKDNWNKLKKYIRKTKLKEFEKSYGKRYGKVFTQSEIVVCNMIMDKIQKLEGSDSNVKD